MLVMVQTVLTEYIEQEEMGQVQHQGEPRRRQER